MLNLVALFFACVIFVVSLIFYWGLFITVDFVLDLNLSVTSHQIGGVLILLLALGTGVSAYAGMTNRDDDD